MQVDLTVALAIALAGMGLVFGAIVLFWILIKVLVRFTGESRESTQEASGRSTAGEAAAGGIPGQARPGDPDWEMKRLAAVAAVGAALAEREAMDEPKPFPLPPAALVSTWQAVMRARQLAQRRTVR